MTTPTHVRVFFAVDLPLTVKEELGKFITHLKKKSKTHAIRWTKPENLHITLQFLPKVHGEDVKKIIENVKEIVMRYENLTPFSFGSIHLFPNPFRPRVIVLDVVPQESLATLANLIGQGIKNSQYEIDERQFRAHLTLGRLKHMHEVNLNFLNDLLPPKLENLISKEIVLFRSEPQPEGSKYTPLDYIPLTKLLKEAN